MKRHIIILLFISFNSFSQNFKKSFKQMKDEGILPDYVENLDEKRNNYSNYYFGVSFDGPDHWQSNLGETEHSILRTYQLDSALSFSIVVIESQVPKNFDIWNNISSNIDLIKRQTEQQISQQFNSKLENFNIKKTYLGGNVAVRTSYNYLLKSYNGEMDLTYITYQVVKGNFTFTFGLYVPTMFYNYNPNSYERLFGKIRFITIKSF